MGRSRIRLVPEGGAAAEIEQVFGAARQSLGLSFVPELLRAYATMPRFLEVMWPSVAPVLRAAEFVSCADRLRAQAYTEAFNYLTPVSPLDAGDAFTAALSVFRHAAPQLLLLTTLALRAMESAVGRERPNGPAPANSAANIRLLGPTEWNILARDVIADYKATRGTNIVTCWMQALAADPAMLAEYWQMLKPLIASPMYARIALELREAAFSLPDDLPIVVDLTPERLADSGLSSGEIGEAGRLTNVFANEYAAMVLDVELGCIAAECGEREPAPTSLRVA